MIGGGLLGLEAAQALRSLGMRPHVVEVAPHLMPLQLDEGAARCWPAWWAARHGRALRRGVASVDAGPDGRVRG